MENWDEKMKRILSVAKPCPFCNSTKLDISNKSNGHTCVYCRSCLTYDPRVLEYGLYEDYKKPWSSTKHWFKTLTINAKTKDYKFIRETSPMDYIPLNSFYTERHDS